MSTPYITTELSGTTQEGTYVGPETCKACHPDQYDRWNATGHAQAANAVPGKTNNATYDDGVCYSCHADETVGAEYFAITASNAPQYAGVSCETCHGPYDGTAGTGHMPYTFAADFCGECHSPFHSWDHGNAEGAWNQSSHASARETLLEGGFEEPECVHCHTAEGALPWPLGGTGTLTTTENSITCPVCHDPHSAANAYNLRTADSTELCATCHEYQAATFEGSNHDVVSGAECVICHMYGWAQDHTGEWTQVTNHTMFTWQGACGQEGCHNDPQAAWAGKEAIQASFADFYALADSKVTEAHEAFEKANATAGADPEKLDEAKAMLDDIDALWHDIGLAGSQGFHNPAGMTAILEQILSDGEEVVQLSTEATGGSVSEPTLQPLAVLGLGIALLIAILRRRRIA